MDNETFNKIRNFVECLRQFQASADSLVTALEKELVQSGKAKRRQSKKQKSLWAEDDAQESAAEPVDEDVVIYTPAQLAKVLGLGRSTTYRLLQSGEIPCVTIANRKKIMGDAVEEYLRNKLQTERE